MWVNTCKKNDEKMRNLTRKKKPKENFKLKNRTVENNISLARFPNKKDTTDF